VYYQLTEAIAGMGEACTALSTPVTGGNVSLYNESPRGAVYPTPVVGMVGVIESLAHVTRATFSTPGDIILLMGDTRDELGASEYMSVIHGTVAGAPPVCDLSAERRAIDALLEAIAAGVISSAHDCSDGGLAVALAESCIANRRAQTGADVELGDHGGLSARSIFFGESQGRFVLSSSAPRIVEEIAEGHGVSIRSIGVVREAGAGFRMRVGDRMIKSDVASLSAAWHDTIPRIMSAPAVTAALPEPESADRSAGSAVSVS